MTSQVVEGRSQSPMFHPDQINPAALVVSPPSIASVARRGCLVDGCPCRDARIVSHRRAAFFAFLARQAGETADRVIVPDPEWIIPTGVDA
jgi:hypothetical protein